MSQNWILPMLIKSFIPLKEKHYVNKGAYIKYAGEGGAEGFTNLKKKKIQSPGDQRPKYFMAL